MELYKKHRPTDLDQVVGQAEAVKKLTSWLKRDEVPQATLFVGPSGCGKTTLARILAARLGAGDIELFGTDKAWDYQEVNGSDARGIDVIRDIRVNMRKRPMASGRARVWVIDECHMLTKDAQNALLKPLEDTPEKVYFMLCTTDPEKLLKTIRTRCSDVVCKLLPRGTVSALVSDVARKEKIKLTKDGLEKLLDYADGSARKALVLLETLIGVEGEDDQVAAVESIDGKRAAFDLVKALMPFKGSPNWAEVANVLTDIAGEDAEGLRWMVLNTAKSRLLKGTGPAMAQAYKTILAFERNFFDSKHAGLAAACYEVVFGK